MGSEHMGSKDRAASPMHRRCNYRRCVGDVDAKRIGLDIEPHRRCIGNAARSSDPIDSDPILEA
eukprot:9451500-Pyramimonas_sp.AAC.1